MAKQASTMTTQNTITSAIPREAIESGKKITKVIKIPRGKK